MIIKFLILHYFIFVSFINIESSKIKADQLSIRMKKLKKSIKKDFKSIRSEIYRDVDLMHLTNKNSTIHQIFTKWSPWSRCMNCIQKRIKNCLHRKCHDTKLFEEKSCGKKRCKRKFRQRKQFHIVYLNKDSNYYTKQAPSRIWSKWSNWSPCSNNCRTQRIRICRKPGRCKKKQQEQIAFCYHDQSNCETYVLTMLDRQNDNTIYEYHNNANRRVTTNGRKITKTCGMPFRKTKMLKIIGGSESKKHQWPWHVAILNRYQEVFCGGTLIAPRWVLTASHCIRPYLRVRLNEHDLRAYDGREMEMVVHTMFQHPKFNHKTVDNDIALLLLPRPVKLPVACLPNDEPKTGDVCSVMGWGKVRSSDTYGINKLHETKLPVVDSSICRRSYRSFWITSNMLCAGWQSGKSDTCAGDSGGGLMCPFKPKPTSKLAYEIQGITSFGDGCGLRNKYGIYTTVYNYLKWIYYIMDHYS